MGRNALLKLQFAVLLILFGILGVMPSPDLDLPGEIPRGDLLAHLIGWTVGAVSGRFAYPLARAIILGGGLWAYSLAIEMAQIVVPTRSFELLDLVSNAVGIIVGLVIMRIVRERWNLQ